MLEEFAKANNYTMQSVLDSFTRNADGSYKGNGNKISFAKYTGLDDKYIADLRRESNELVRNTLTDVIDANISFLTDKTITRIAITDENKDILTRLANEGYGRVSYLTNEFIVDSFVKTLDEFVISI